MAKEESDPLTLAFGITVRQLREQHRQRGKASPMTQEELGRRLGMDRSYITALESGNHNPTLMTLWKLLPVLGVTPAKFMRALTRNYERPKTEATEPRTTPIEEALARLRAFLDQSPEMQWLGSPHLKTVHCNQPMLDYLGLTLADLEGRTAWQKVVHPDDMKGYVAEHKKAIARREPNLSRYRMLGADGQYREFVEHAVPQFTSKGVFIGFLGTLIQEPENGEEAIKRLRDFMDQSPEMKWLADARQGALYCNRPLRDYVGVEHQLDGFEWQELFHPDDLVKYLAKSKKMFDGREPYHSRYRMRGADGQYKSMVQHAVPQYTPKGVFIGYLGTLIQEPENG